MRKVFTHLRHQPEWVRRRVAYVVIGVAMVLVVGVWIVFEGGLVGDMSRSFGASVTSLKERVGDISLPSREEPTMIREEKGVPTTSPDRLNATTSPLRADTSSGTTSMSF